MRKFKPQWYTVSPFHRGTPDDIINNYTIKNLHVLARAVLYLSNNKEKYTLRISADDYYKVYINGSFAGQGPAPSSPENYYYNAIDITPFLKEGKNVIAAHVYYQGLVNRVWNSGDGRMALAAEVLEEENGEETVYSLSWKYKRSDAFSGEILGYDTQFTENFDSRLWDENWNQPEFDDRLWKAMEPALWADYCLEPQPVAMPEIYDKHPAICRKGKKHRWFIDAGQEITGGLIIKAAADAGKKVWIRCGEELSEDGSVRFDMRCGCRYEEVWTLADGECLLEPYDYKGFRYAEIAAEDGVELREVRIRIRHYPMDDSLCTIQAGEPLLEQIFGICKNAVKYGTQESFLDCPTREKGQYLGDAVITSRSHAWLTGNTDMLRKCISQFATSARISKGILGVAPGSYIQKIADFSLLFPQLLLNDYLFTGDKDYLARYYPTALSMMQHFAAYEGTDGLLHRVTEEWNLVDWPDSCRDGYDYDLDHPENSCGCHNVINALYTGAMKLMNEIEEILDYPPSGDWREKCRAYQRAFYRPQMQLFADSTVSDHTAVHSNIYALYYGLVPEEARENVADFLAEKGFCCGVFLSYFMLKGLARAERYKDVYRLLLNRSEHGWVQMLREGATACFEAWGKEQKWNTSLCHPWASAPVSILIEDIAGIRLAPDKKKGYVFEPHIPECLEQFEMRAPFREHTITVKKSTECQCTALYEY